MKAINCKTKTTNDTRTSKITDKQAEKAKTNKENI